jgi:hypothetical protein
MNPEAMTANKMKIRAADAPDIQPAICALTSEDSEDLSRFEGEGGLEAPVPATEMIDVPLENAIWRRPRWSASQMHQTEIAL